MHSRAILLQKELMNPLLQIIRKVHLSSVNEIATKIATVQMVVQEKFHPQVAPAVSAPKDHQKVMKGSLG